MSVEMTESPRPPAWRKVAGLAVLALLGALVGGTFAQLTDGRFDGWEDEANALLGLVLVCLAVVSAVVVARRPASVPKDCGLLQVAVLGLAGAMLLIPVFAPETWPSGGVFGAVMGLLLVQSVANLLLWRRSDELVRRVTAESGALAFWVLQAALFVYAVAERVGLVETISGWGLLAVMMAVYLIASSIAAWRRGLG